MLTKEEKEVDMFLLTGVQPALMVGLDEGGVAPPAFVQRYRTYFGKDPVAFPSFLINTSAGTLMRQP